LRSLTFADRPGIERFNVKQPDNQTATREFVSYLNGRLEPYGLFGFQKAGQPGGARVSELCHATAFHLRDPARKSKTGIVLKN
jgi:hypothetical protein